MNRAARDALAIKREALLAKKGILDFIDLLQRKAGGTHQITTQAKFLAEKGQIVGELHFNNILNAISKEGVVTFKKLLPPPDFWKNYQIEVTFSDKFDAYVYAIRDEYHRLNEKLEDGEKTRSLVPVLKLIHRIWNGLTHNPTTSIVLGAIIIFLISVYFKIDLTNPNKDNVPETKSLFYANLQNISNLNDSRKADCWVTSLSSNRSDAFRCSVDNRIYDPCFENATGEGGFIVCPGEPHEKNLESFRIISRPEYNSEVDKGASVPWYIILKNNQACRFLTGATTVVADRRLDYGCSEGIYDSLFLPMKEDGKVLEIGCSTEDRIESCPIKEVWY